MRSVILTRAVVAVATILLAGCATPAKPAATAAATSQPAEAAGGDLSNTDPCATRLHDLSGLLLLYFDRHNALPQTLADLDELEAFGLKSPPAVCPKTGTPYLYNPGGIYLADTNQYVLVYDAAPVHAGFRWAILGKEPTATQGPVFKVIPLPERFFALRPPG